MFCLLALLGSGVCGRLPPVASVLFGLWRAALSGDRLVRWPAVPVLRPLCGVCGGQLCLATGLSGGLLSPFCWCCGGQLCLATALPACLCFLRCGVCGGQLCLATVAAERGCPP